MVKTRSEDTIILNGFNPSQTKMEPVYDALYHFCEIKKSFDESSRFNIILFQEDGSRFLEHFTLYQENILTVFRALYPTITKGNLSGGIFLAISIIINTYKKVSQKTFRLIILTDSGSSKIPKLFMPILEILIDQIKNLPFFIDIVRLNTDDLEEDEKLMDLIGRCNGGIHETNSEELLKDLLELLALKREIEVSSLIEEKNYTIPLENQQFYINLAELPIKQEELETCSICFKKDDKPMVKCPNCDAVTHTDCWFLWTAKSSIGIPHIFRCHNCYYLISLPKDYVQRMGLATRVNSAQIMPKKSFDEIYEHLEKLEAESSPELATFEYHMENPEIVGDLGALREISEKGFTIENNDEEIKFILCPHCYKMITSVYTLCPVCHKKIK